MTEKTIPEVIYAFRRSAEVLNRRRSVWEQINFYMNPLKYSYENTSYRGTGGVSVGGGIIPGGSTEGSELTQHIFDSTGIEAAQDLVSTMQNNLTPIQHKWFVLMPAPSLLDKNGERSEEFIDEARKILVDIEDVIFDHIKTSDFDKEMGSFLEDLILLGTAIMYVAPKRAGAGNSRLLIKALSPYQIVFTNDSETDEPTQFYREFLINPEDLAYQFPQLKAWAADFIEKRDARTSEDEDKARDKRLRIVEAVYADPTRRASGDALPWRYEIIHLPQLDNAESQGNKGKENDKDAVSIHGEWIAQSPFIILHWKKAPGDTYGRGLGDLNLPRVRGINKMMEANIKAVELATRKPLMISHEDSMTGVNEKSIQPDSLIVVQNTDRNAPKPLDFTPEIVHSDNAIERERTDIRRGFLSEELPTPKSESLTQDEVNYRTQQISRRLAAPFARFQIDFARPFLNRIAAALASEGLIPSSLGTQEIRIDGNVVEAKLATLYSRQQDAQDIQNIMAYVETIATIQAGLTDEVGQVLPLLRLSLNVETLPHEIARLLLLDPKFLVSPEELKEGIDAIDTEQAAKGAAQGLGGGEQPGGGGGAPGGF